MLNKLEDTTVTYEDLAGIERDFDNVEKELVRQEIILSAPIYARRNALTSKIPNFWPLVFEQAPPEIDQYIQMADGELLLGALTSLSVTRFEPDIDPRSVSFRFEFSENKYLIDRVLEKKFWWRTAPNKSWRGLVSEVVYIKWKSASMDLTHGLLDLLISAEKSVASRSISNESDKETTKKIELTDAQKELRRKLEEEGTSGQSFFNWFGFIGKRISAEESAKAEIARQESAKESLIPQIEEDDDISEDDELEIFPGGGELALAISEDLWPDAIKYFIQAQEQDVVSDADFESIDGNDAAEYEDEDQDEDEEEKSRVAKKQKSN